MEYMLQMENVSKSFGEVKCLSNVNFKVKPGEVVGLLGDNGAGKSTLIKIITGYHQPNPGGTIFLERQQSRKSHCLKSTQIGH